MSLKLKSYTYVDFQENLCQKNYISPKTAAPVLFKIPLKTSEHWFEYQVRAQPHHDYAGIVWHVRT